MNSKLPSGTAITILLVEDDDGDAKAVRRTFEKEKIANRIVRAIDGVEALEMLRGTNGREKIHPPYILLVDLNMPRMGGLDLLKAIRADEELRGNVIFILSTSNREEDKKAAYDLNVAGYIVKERAGQDFLNVITLVDCYWRIVELP